MGRGGTGCTRFERMIENTEESSNMLGSIVVSSTSVDELTSFLL